uniref:Uncharacterized protein n=1 Tax=Rhizophora mucronata TaxID=61149 RepID=A0A2P2QU44_RHIMU
MFCHLVLLWNHNVEVSNTFSSIHVGAKKRNINTTW